MENLPRWLKFKILSSLPLIDIGTMRLVSNSWYKTVFNLNFWTFKVREEFGCRYDINTINMAGKLWYDRICNSGKLFQVKNDHVNYMDLEMTDICVYRYCGGCHYYVDVDGNLYYRENLMVSRNFNSYGFYIDNELYERTKKQFRGIGESLYGNLVDKPIKVDNIQNVKDIVPTNIGDLVLTLDGNLYASGKLSGDKSITKLILQKTNIKSIDGRSVMCFYLTYDNELWAYVEEFAIPKLVSTNVKSACIRITCREPDSQDLGGITTTIYFIKNDQVYTYCNGKTLLFKINRILDIGSLKSIFVAMNCVWVTYKFLNRAYKCRDKNDNKDGWNSFPYAGKMVKNVVTGPFDLDEFEYNRDYEYKKFNTELCIFKDEKYYDHYTIKPNGYVTNAFVGDKIYFTKR